GKQSLPRRRVWGVGCGRLRVYPTPNPYTLRHPADREVGEALQRFAPVAIRHPRQRLAGEVGVGPGEVQGGADRARTEDQLAGAAEVVFGAIALVDGAVPEGVLAAAGAGGGEQQRQGD